MALHASWTELESDLNSIALHLRDFAAAKARLRSPADFSFLDECLLEGLLSRLWQAWNAFCRNCVMKSCMGTIDATGALVTGLPDAISEAHVSAAAILAKKQPRPPYWGAPNASLRAEPTWGDADVLANLLSRLRPSNAGKMLAAISSAYPRAKALQVIRNGAAHNHFQNVAEIQLLRSSYTAFPILHPTHAMFWIEPRSNDFLITHVIDVLKGAGLDAIS